MQKNNFFVTEIGHGVDTKQIKIVHAVPSTLGMNGTTKQAEHLLNEQNNYLFEIEFGGEDHEERVNNASDAYEALVPILYKHAEEKKNGLSSLQEFRNNVGSVATTLNDKEFVRQVDDTLYVGGKNLKKVTKMLKETGVICEKTSNQIEKQLNSIFSLKNLPKQGNNTLHFRY